MSQHKTKHIIYITFLAALAVAFSLAGCRDDIIYSPVDIPDGEVEVIGEVVFKPLSPIEIQTRSEEAPAGDIYEGISSLYVFFFESIPVDGGEPTTKLVKEYSGSVTPEKKETDGTHAHYTFKKRVWAGEYYVYAVANITAAEGQKILDKVVTKEDLRNFELSWDDNVWSTEEGKMGTDNEMFGVFKVNENLNCSSSNPSPAPTNTEFEADNLISITPTYNIIHAWVRRATSKVTIDFDGSGLKDGVTVYIKNARLKDLPKASFLGKASKVEKKEDLGESNYVITYGSQDGATDGAVITNQITEDSKFNPTTIWGEEAVTSFHADNAPSLPCYENLQGKHTDKSKLQDKDNDGIIDSFDKDDVELGTYLEVEGYYVANRPEYKSEGKIIYRFMLGQDAVNDFDLIRNHHYQITMNFKGYGNDVDWHIVYNEKYLDVSYPEDVNYKGEFFKPSTEIWDTPNAGHDLSTDNTITVTSYSTDGKNTVWYEPTVTYAYWKLDSSGKWVEDNGEKWLESPESTESPSSPLITTVSETQKNYTYTAKPQTAITDNGFPAASTTGAGSSKDSPYNLSNNAGNGAITTIKNTANSYIVNAPGWYCLPLVYGNAITNGLTNQDAYASGKSDHFVNHLGKNISDPWIISDCKKASDNPQWGSNLKAVLIWQDAENLISVSTIEYVSTLFKGGGIRFQIPSGKEGNAVIALIDPDMVIEETSDKGGDKTTNWSEWDCVHDVPRENEIEYDDGSYNNENYKDLGVTKAVWSWHIWVTRFGSGDFEETITIINRKDKSFDVMPVNLGWCSEKDGIKYFPRRKCDITFTVGNNRIIRTIEQYPHFALKRGDHPYYQWGRKDPFIGTNERGNNKPRWARKGDGSIVALDKNKKNNPPRLFSGQETNPTNGEKLNWQSDKRKSTVECLHWLVRNPDKWHNGPRHSDKEQPTPGDFVSHNSSYSNLWSNDGKKTVYDPCPPGYMVSPIETFSGFITDVPGVTDAKKVDNGQHWNDVLEPNMLDNFYDTQSVPINAQVIEMYTDPRKIQSITFPVTGYRDYDQVAGVLAYYPGKEDEVYCCVWTNEWESSGDLNGEYQANPEYYSAHLKMYRHSDANPLGNWKKREGLIGIESFYNTDGFAVRPVKIKKAGEDQEESPPTP